MRQNNEIINAKKEIAHDYPTIFAFDERDGTIYIKDVSDKQSRGEEVTIGEVLRPVAKNLYEEVDIFSNDSSKNRLWRIFVMCDYLKYLFDFTGFLKIVTFPQRVAFDAQLRSINFHVDLIREWLSEEDETYTRRLSSHRNLICGLATNASIICMNLGVK